MAFQPSTVPGFQPLLPAIVGFEVLQQLILLDMPQHLEQILFLPAMERSAVWPWELMGDKVETYKKNAEQIWISFPGTHATSTAHISQWAALVHIAVVVAFLTWATMDFESKAAQPLGCFGINNSIF